MNIHEPLMARDPHPVTERRRLSRPALVALVIAAIALAAVAAAFLLGGGGDDAAPAAAASGAADPAEAGPSVSVMVPGSTAVQNMVRVSGSLAARRDLPVGVQGAGGMVTAVAADAGDYVRRGQVLARLDRSVQVQQVAQLEAGLAQAVADAALAQSELDRAAALVDRGFISKADIDRKTAARDSARARVNVAAAQLREAQARLSQLSVVAPEAGLVLERNVEKGQVVGPGSGALFRIAQGGQMELRAEVSEAELQRVEPGQTATVSLIGSSEEYRGEVWLVEPIIDQESRLGLARITLTGNRDLRPGAFATGVIVTGTATGPVLPESAVLGEVGDSFVYIVDDENRAVRRDIVVGDITSEGVTIAEGLTGNERVVVSAGAFLNAGETVRPSLVKQAG